MDSTSSISIPNSSLSKGTHTKNLGSRAYCQTHSSIPTYSTMHNGYGQARGSGVLLHKPSIKKDVSKTVQEREASIQAPVRQPKGRSNSVSSMDNRPHHKKKVSSPLKPVSKVQPLLQPVYKPGSEHNVHSGGQSKRQVLPGGELRGVAGCKVSSGNIIKQLVKAGANYLGFQPIAPREIEFGERVQISLWASYLGERSLCPVAHIADGELYRGASGKFYFHINTLVYALGFSVESVSSVFTNVPLFNRMNPVSIFDLKARYKACLSQVWIKRPCREMGKDITALPPQDFEQTRVDLQKFILHTLSHQFGTVKKIPRRILSYFFYWGIFGVSKLYSEPQYHSEPLALKPIKIKHNLPYLRSSGATTKHKDSSQGGPKVHGT